MTTRFDAIRDARPDDRPWPDMVWPVAAGTTLSGEVVELSVLDIARDGADLFAALDDDRVWAHMSSRPRSVALSQVASTVTSPSATNACRRCRSCAK